MVAFPNPYLEERKKSKGELAQEWAGYVSLASSVLGLSFTDTEKRAFAVVIGAFMRERKKIHWLKVLKLAAKIAGKK